MNEEAEKYKRMFLEACVDLGLINEALGLDPDSGGAAPIIAAIVELQLQQPTREPMVRYCPGCGSIGAVGSQYRDCCPDGSDARMVPKKFAQQCHDTFKLAIRALMQNASSEKEGS